MCLSTPRMVPLNTQNGASQHPGWCLSTPRMVSLNTQNGASQHPEWCLSTPRMVPLNTQDGASQYPGWCLSTPRMVPLSTLGMVPLPALRIGQGWMWQQIAFGRVGSREHFLTLGFPTHSHLESVIPIAVLLPEA